MNSGKNIITRDSQLFHRYVRDRTTFFDLYKMVMLVHTGDHKLKLDQTVALCGFPSRGVGSGARYLDTLPMGYPFDYLHQFYDEGNWMTQNMDYVDVNIFHKNEIDINNKN